MALEVMIVEDEMVVAEDLKRSLQHLGYQVSWLARSGREAIEQFKTKRPDLIFMDVKIQGDLNGIETALVLHGSFPDPVPIIFLSAYRSEDFPYLKAVNSYFYLHKPYTEEQLQDSIGKAIAKLRPRGEN